MSVLEYIDQELKKIEEDVRFGYTPASVTTNPMLAIIQIELKVRHATLLELKAKVEEEDS